MARKEKLAKSAGQPPPPPEADEIDLGAALPAAPAPKRPRGRPANPAGPQPKPRNPARKIRSDKGKTKTPPAPYIDNNNILLNIGVDDIGYSNDGEFITAKDLKGKMSVKELKFLGLYFTGDYSKIKAMKSAGYEASHDNYLYLLAKKILEKYESQGEDHRIIARAMGAGETLVFNSLLSLMKSKNEKIRLDATVNLAKILGLTKEQLETAGGITIIFEGGDQPGPAALALPPGGEPLPGAAPYPGRVLQITK